MSMKSIRVVVVSLLALACLGAVIAVTQAHGQSNRSTGNAGAQAAAAKTSGARASAAKTPAAKVAPPVGAVPSDPITDFTPNQEFFVSDNRGQYANVANTNPEGSYAGYFTSGYWTDVPPSYRRDNRTPETLMVWMHGCEGTAKYDAAALSNLYTNDRDYILISLSGPENAGVDKGDPDCWNSSDQADVEKVLADVKNVETHFNIDRRRVFIGGYSSGGDLAWQTIFLHADTFAGILANNTNPVRDNTFGEKWGLTAINHAIAGAAYQFHVVQLDHSGDDAYHVARCGYTGYPTCPSGDPTGTTNPDAGVTPAIDALEAAGFPVIYKILPGRHYEPDTPKNCENHQPATCTAGTYHDIATFLMPQLKNRSWVAPAS